MLHHIYETVPTKLCTVSDSFIIFKSWHGILGISVRETPTETDLILTAHADQLTGKVKARQLKKNWLAAADCNMVVDFIATTGSRPPYGDAGHRRRKDTTRMSNRSCSQSAEALSLGVGSISQCINCSIKI
jgi:hypothetical protein